MFDVKLTRDTLDERFPAAACSKEMLADLKSLARREGTSESAIIRAGVALILELKSSKSSENIEKQVDADYPS